MKDITFSDMKEMQLKLHEIHKHDWMPLEPENGKISILWMMDELGEAIAIIKKKGEWNIMNNPDVRKHFVEELSDVLMYFNDMMICYNITPEEISQAYIEKHERNMKRNYRAENEVFV